ncbi:MAG TPA: helix-turn-helix domain-containing protein [Terriglobia bacterium]|nr:helix-turn-helix domain-containing protein [Terriglobia bacterium]
MNTTGEVQKLLNDREAGRALGVTADGMRGWRAKGIGPPWIRIGKRLVRYDPAALRAWIEAQATEKRIPGGR